MSTVTDAAGNNVAASTNNTFTIDTTAPTATITSPLVDAVVKNGNVNLGFDSTDGSVCAYSVGGGSYTPLADCTSPKTITLADGRNSIVLKVTDVAGNFKESDAVSFVVDTNNNLTVGATSADFATIQEAVTKATAGDTISVAAGTYAEPIQTLVACNEPASLCIDKPLTLRGEPGDAAAGPGLNAPVLNGTGTWQRFCNSPASRQCHLKCHHRRICYSELY